MVFGLMAFSTAAHATAGAQWLLFEKAPGSGAVGFLEAEVGLTAVTPGVLHSKIAGITVLFECTTLSAVNAKLKASGGIGTGAKIKFSGCITKLNGATSNACKPKAGGTEEGVINTQAGHGLIVLHELAGGVKDDLVSITPDSGETFAFIEMGAECAIGTKVAVIGKATLKDCKLVVANECTEEFLTTKVEHFVTVGPLTELWVISKTPEHVSTILGDAEAKFVGADAGLKFKGDAA
jgi:hypothetical protein